MAKRITREECEAVKAAEKKERNKNQSKKLKIIIMRYEGKSNREIGEKLDLSSDRVSHLVSEFKTKGLEEYLRVKYPGNHRNMSYEEEQEILDSFTAKAEAGQVITVREIKAEFDKKLGRDTGRGYIYMLLRRHGWRKIKPRSQHPERASDEEIAASKKLKPAWKSFG